MSETGFENTVSIRVRLPQQLCALARVNAEVAVPVGGAVTQRSILNALEAAYPKLRGTIRDHSGQRRPKVRIFACNEAVSHESPDVPLPAAIVSGAQPLFIIGAISGG